MLSAELVGSSADFCRLNWSQHAHLRAPTNMIDEQAQKACSSAAELVGAELPSSWLVFRGLGDLWSDSSK